MLVALMVVGAAPLRAVPYTLGNNLVHFAVYGFGAGFTAAPAAGALAVAGNIGVGPGGTLALGGAGVSIAGRIFFAGPLEPARFAVGRSGSYSIGGATCSSYESCLAGGSLVGGSGFAAAAARDELAIHAAVAGLTPGITLAGISSSTLIDGADAGTTVVNVNGNVKLLGSTLTIHGTASDYVVFNIKGRMSGGTGGRIVLTGGIGADHVLFNFLCSDEHAGVCGSGGGSAASISFSGNFVGSGIILGLDRNITVNTPGGGWNGRFFSGALGSIDLVSRTAVTQPTSLMVNPEPATLLLLGTGLLGIARAFRRRPH